MASNRFDAIINDTDSSGPLEEKFGTIVHDVEMKSEMEAVAAPPTQPEVFLVLDTNVLLNSLNVFAEFVKDIERQNIPLTIVIPRAVLNELDFQKSNPEKKDLQWFSRRASSWIFEEMRRTNHVKGQALSETLPLAEQSLIPQDELRKNDHKILHCAIFFSRIQPTFLCTGDNNLGIFANSEDINVIAFNPRAAWSSHRLAQSIFPSTAPIDFSGFSRYEKSYKHESSVTKREVDSMDMDMDVDEDDLTMTFVDARNSLHLQVIDHFKSLLAELVVCLEKKIPVGSDGASQSIHAPGSIHAPSLRPRNGKKVSEWNISELLGYLEATDLSLGAILRPLPRLETFLTEPYRGTGARRGQEWSPADWLQALKKLKKIGERWEKESSILGSLNDLEPHLRVVFGQAMQM